MKTQYRLQNRWFKDPVLVLQVWEPTKTMFYNDDDYDWCAVNFRKFDRPGFWRDATIEDIQFFTVGENKRVALFNRPFRSPLLVLQVWEPGQEQASNDPRWIRNAEEEGQYWRYARVTDLQVINRTRVV